MEEKNRKKKTHFFEIYISKVLKQICDCGITGNAKQQLNSFLCILSKKVSNTVLDLTLFGKKKTISEKEIINALNIILPGELLKNSISEGKKSIESFKTNNEKDIKGTRQTKAQIIFPPSITEKFLRNFGNTKIMVTSTSPVFLAAVLEYLTYEVLDLASIYCKDNKRIRITIRDLEVVIRSDEELNKLFTKLNITFLGGGVVPYIHESLLKKNKKKRTIIKNVNNTNNPKQHRFRPGTVAIRDIKKHQKTSDNLILAKSSFEKLVRQIFKENRINIENVKISKDVFIILQHFIEQYIVKLFYNSNFLAIHSGRVKLLSIDIAFISYLYNDSKNPYNSLLNNNSVFSIYENNEVIEENEEERIEANKDESNEDESNEEEANEVDEELNEEEVDDELNEEEVDEDLDDEEDEVTDE
jgi:histone H2A